MEIILASNNPHKREEFGRLLAGHVLLLPADLGIGFDHEETGSTFMENSLGKAAALHRLLPPSRKIPVLADDSGISVPSLNGDPGVYSARYGQDVFGRPLSTPERNTYLLTKLRGTADRRAFFVCAMVLLFDEYRYFTAQEILEGRVAEAPEGSGGFGYDPLLYIPEVKKTVAQLSPEEKDRLSHRGKAARVLRIVLETLETGAAA